MLRPKHLAAIVLTVLCAGCQLRLGVDVAVARDGSGSLELAVALDEELLTLLTEAGFDADVGLAEAAAGAPEWEVEELPAEGGLARSFRTEFEDPAEFARLLDEFQQGVDAEDAALFDDLTIEVDDAGAVTFSGEAGLLLPASTGAEGEGVAFDADDLAALLEERGRDYVRYDLRVTLPAEPVTHDGDRREGATVTWELPVGELRSVTARAAPAPDRTVHLAAAAAALAAVAGALGMAWFRRRRALSRRGRGPTPEG